MRAITKDDSVEIAATFLGAFILGASFAKDFFMHGKFEVRIFFLGVSCFVLFLVISVIAGVRIRFFQRSQPGLSLAWIVLFTLGNLAAVDLFFHQFLGSRIEADIEGETVLFLVCYSLATNLLFALNRRTLLSVLQEKTLYKYLIAPINGIAIGAVLTGLLVWLAVP